MSNSIITMILVVFLAGATGGVVNALMTENGFLLPKKELVGNASTIMRPGFLGNVIIGGVGSTISWGLYGPLSSYLLISTLSKDEFNKDLNAGLSLAGLVGAMLVGISGARWLTNEVDKSLLKAAATRAAGAVPSTNAAQQIAISTPAQALEVAKSMTAQ